MLRTLLAAACLTAAAAPAVTAHPSYDYRGGCAFVAVTTDDADVRWTVAVTASAVARDVTGAPAAVPIEVACEVTVGTAAPLTFATASGVGAAAAADATTLTFDAYVSVTVCEVVTVAGETHRACTDSTEVVPGPVVEAIELVVDTINEQILSRWGPPLCPMLAALAPGVPGVIDITAEGDVYVVTQGFVWDCPPYATEYEDRSVPRWLVRVP